MSESDASLAGYALAHIEDAYLVAEPDFDGAEYTTEEWVSLCNFADRLGAAARAFKKHAQSEIARQLGPGAGIRVGDQWVREGQGGKWKIKDAAALSSFLDDSGAWADVVNLAAPGAVTVTRLKGYLTATDHDGGAVDTFFEREPDGAVVTILPLEKAPKFVAKLADGQVWRPKPKLSEGRTTWERSSAGYAGSEA